MTEAGQKPELLNSTLFFLNTGLRTQFTVLMGSVLEMAHCKARRCPSTGCYVKLYAPLGLCNASLSWPCPSGLSDPRYCRAAVVDGAHLHTGTLEEKTKDLGLPVLNRTHSQEKKTTSNKFSINIYL